MVTAKEVIDNYPNVYYKASNDRFYKLKDIYPFCFPVANKPDCFCLDTSGEMASCDFFIATIRHDKELWRQLDRGGWKRIAPEIKIGIGD